MSRPLLLVLLLGLGGCYRVRITTEPVGASVAVAGGDGTVAPARVRVPPLGARRVTVSAASYRSLAFDLRWNPLGWLRRSNAVEVRLVEEHGPSR